MKVRYPRAKPFINIDPLMDDIGDILISGNLTNGEYARRFEKEFAEMVGTRYAVAVNTGTAALEVTLKSLGIQGKKVMVPTNTFVATGNAVVTTGNIPVFVDINKDTLCASYQSIVENNSEDVVALILVHMGGLITPEFHKIKDYCHRKGIMLIEDAAHAHGSSHNSLKAGNLLSVAGCFSFYSTKVMTTGEGGMITTNNHLLQKKMILYRSHGGDGRNFYHNSSNYRMPEIEAAIGLSQLKQLDKFIERRNQIAKEYGKLLEGINGVTLFPRYDSGDNVRSYWNFWILLDASIDRDKVMDDLLAYGIQTGDAYFPPCHKQPAFERFIAPGQEFPVADDILSRHLSLPMYVGLESDNLKYIVDCLKKVLP